MEIVFQNFIEQILSILGTIAYLELLNTLRPPESILFPVTKEKHRRTKRHFDDDGKITKYIIRIYILFNVLPRNQRFITDLKECNWNRREQNTVAASFFCCIYI